MEETRAESYALFVGIESITGFTTSSNAYGNARYVACRAAGHSHGRVLRGIGDLLLAALIAVLKSQKDYDSSRLGAIANTRPATT
jgi:hypothetical protein